MKLSELFTLGNGIKAMLLFGVFALFGVLVQSCNGPKSAIDRYAVASLKKLTH